MQRKVKVAQYGIGRIGSIVTGYTLAKGGELVAAFARNPAQIGRDLGEVVGIGSIGLAVSSSADLDVVLKAAAPDICVISTGPSLRDVKEVMSCCIRNRVNVLDIGENAFWPWTAEASDAAELDALAKQFGVTVSASGFPDVCWGTLISAFAASSNRITKIRCDSTLNLEAYNADYMFDYHGVGLTVEEFERRFGSAPIREIDGHVPCLPGDQNAWLCARLGLTVREQTFLYEPIVRKTDFFSRSLNRTIPAGVLEGLTQICRTVTEEGIVLELAMSGRMEVRGAAEHTVWKLFGEPDSVLSWDNPATYEITCATAVNRIPDVLNALPGYVTTDRFPPCRYLVKPMNLYVNDG